MRKLLLILMTAAVLAGCATHTPGGKHLFILSGQSNIARMDPDQRFRPLLEQHFGKDNILVVKDAAGGQAISRWDKQWALPIRDPLNAPGEKSPGDLYERLTRKVLAATENQHVASISLIWMQGESDAYLRYGDIYKESVLRVYSQLQEDLHYRPINWVIGRISDYDLKNRAYKDWTRIRSIQMEIADSNPRFTWVDTDDLNDNINEAARLPMNDLHYSDEGYQLLGERFAEAAIRLIEKNDK